MKKKNEEEEHVTIESLVMKQEEEHVTAVTLENKMRNIVLFLSLAHVIIESRRRTSYR